MFLGLRKSQLQAWGILKAFKFVNWDAKVGGEMAVCQGYMEGMWMEKEAGNRCPGYSSILKVMGAPQGGNNMT